MREQEQANERHALTEEQHQLCKAQNAQHWKQKYEQKNVTREQEQANEQRTLNEERKLNKNTNKKT